VKDLPIPFVTQREDANLERHVAVGTVILQYFLGHFLGGDQLPHQSIIVDVDVVDLAVYLGLIFQGNPHQGTEAGCIELVHPAAHHETGCPGP
jgi:hypothetical protein